MNLIEKFRRFMQGRNGMDKLNFFLLMAYLLFNGVGYMFYRSWSYRYMFSGMPGLTATGIIGLILRFIGFLLLLFAIFRFFSRNLYKRGYENDRFLSFIARFRRKGTSNDEVSNYREVNYSEVDYRPERKPHEFKKHIKLRWKYRKTHRFRTCPNCSEFLRLGKKRGNRNVTCPKCGKQFSVHIIF